MPVLLPLSNFTFELFCTKLEDEESSYIRVQVEDFIKAFNEMCQAETPIRQNDSPVASPESSQISYSGLDNPRAGSEETLHVRQMRRGREFKRILESFCVVIVKDSFWQLMDSTGKLEATEDSTEFLAYADLILSHLEAYVAPRIHRNLFVPEKKVDWEFVVRCKEFEWLRPTNLDIPLLPLDLAPVVERCTLHFTNMAFEKSPSAKSHHLSLAWSLLQKCLKHLADNNSEHLNTTTSSSASGGYSKAATMDDIMPLLVYIVIKAQPPQLYSDLAYLTTTSRDLTIGSLTSFYITNTQVAVEFIRTLALDKLSTANEQMIKPGRLHGVFDDAMVPSPSSKAQAAFKDFLETGRSRVRSTFEKVSESVTDTVTRVRELGPISTIKAAVGAPIGKPLIPGSPSLSASSPSINVAEFVELDTTEETSSSLLLPSSATCPDLSDLSEKTESAEEEKQEEPWTQNYRFWNADAETMTVEDIRLLLADYKDLIRKAHS